MSIDKYEIVNEILIWINNDEECSMTCEECRFKAVCKIVTDKRVELERVIKEALNERV